MLRGTKGQEEKQRSNRCLTCSSLAPFLPARKVYKHCRAKYVLGKGKRKSSGVLAAYSRLAEQLRDWVIVSLDH